MFFITRHSRRAKLQSLQSLQTSPLSLLTLFLVFLVLAHPARAVNKCVVNGKASYSDKPCAQGEASVLPSPPAASAADVDAARKAEERAAQRLAAIERAHERDERQRRLEQQRVARAEALQTRQCTRLLRRVEAERNDLARLGPMKSKESDNARRALRKAEDAAADCHESRSAAR